MKSDIIFKDKNLEKSLRENGFAVVPMLEENDISYLLEMYRKYFEPIEREETDQININSNATSPVDTKKIIYEAVKQVFTPRLEKYVENFYLQMGIFFIKKASLDKQAGVNTHIDPTLIMDEGENWHINMWCPLQDVDENNGALHVLRGGHVFFPPVVCNTLPFPFSDIEETVYQNLECIPMKAGEMLLFDSRMIHCSKHNNSGKTRVAAVLTMVAPDRQFISLFRDPKRKNAPVEIYFQPDGYYFQPEYRNTEDRPVTGKKMGKIDYEHFKISKEEFQDLMKNPRPFKKYKYNIVPDKEPSFFKRLLEKIRG